jgi:hypothetical protein
MKWKDIVIRYRDEWVLLEVTKVDKELGVKEARVLFHLEKRDDV